MGRFGGWIALALLLAGPAAAQAIEGREPVVFPDYAAYRGIENYAATAEIYDEAQTDPRFIMERIRYRSGELAVFAYVYRLREMSPGARAPVVVFNRGGYVRDDFSPEVLMMGRRFAERGYIVSHRCCAAAEAPRAATVSAALICRT